MKPRIEPTTYWVASHSGAHPCHPLNINFKYIFLPRLSGLASRAYSCNVFEKAFWRIATRAIIIMKIKISKQQLNLNINLKYNFLIIIAKYVRAC
jgi:hypothetical protein